MIKFSLVQSKEKLNDFFINGEVIFCVDMPMRLGRRQLRYGLWGALLS